MGWHRERCIGPACAGRAGSVSLGGAVCATVVVVEDDSSILALLRDVLETDGFRVVAIGRPDIAGIAQAGRDVDLFLIDLMLPGMSGVELAGQLRAHGFPRTPMIAMSASRLMLEMAVRSGRFEDVLSKPFNLSTVLDHVERLTGMRSLSVQEHSAVV